MDWINALGTSNDNVPDTRAQQTRLPAKNNKKTKTWKTNEAKGILRQKAVYKWHKKSTQRTDGEQITNAQTKWVRNTTISSPRIQKIYN